MRYTKEQIQEWIKQGQAISPHVAIEMIVEMDNQEEKLKAVKLRLEALKDFVPYNCIGLIGEALTAISSNKDKIGLI